MSPGVTALVEFIEAMPGKVSAMDFARLSELAAAVRREDPLAVAFNRASAGFRKAEGR